MLAKLAPCEASAASRLAKTCVHWASKSDGVEPSGATPVWPAMNRNSDALTRVMCEYCPSGLPRTSGLSISMLGMDTPSPATQSPHIAPPHLPLRASECTQPCMHDLAFAKSSLLKKSSGLILSTG